MLLFVERTLFSRCFQKPAGSGTGRTIDLFIYFFLFSIISITEFGGVCLLGSARYKQTFVFVCDQTAQAGVSRGLCGNGALLVFFSDMQGRHEFPWLRKAGLEFLLG